MTPNFALLGSRGKEAHSSSSQNDDLRPHPSGEKMGERVFQHAAFLAYLSTPFSLNPHPGEGTWEPTSKMTPDFLAPLGESGTETPFFPK
jgi:hypothetical protein